MVIEYIPKKKQNAIEAHTKNYNKRENRRQREDQTKQERSRRSWNVNEKWASYRIKRSYE